MDADLIDKRLAGLVLESHRDIEFQGNPTEVAYQFARAVCAIREALDAAGVRGIDYSHMLAPKADSPSARPDAEYAAHVRRLSALERIAQDAFSDVDDRDLFLWSCARLDMRRETDPDTGLAVWSPYSTQQACDAYRDAYGVPVRRRTAHNRIRRLDEALDDEIARRGFKAG